MIDAISVNFRYADAIIQSYVEGHSDECLFWYLRRHGKSMALHIIERNLRRYTNIKPYSRTHLRVECQPWWMVYPTAELYTAQGTPSLIIVRGLPGTGRTTLSRKWNTTHIPVEASHFFYRQNRRLCFYPRLVSLSYQWSLLRTTFHLKQGRNVVVSGRFMQENDLMLYILLGEHFRTNTRILQTQDIGENPHFMTVKHINWMRDHWEEREHIYGIPVEHITNTSLPEKPLSMLPYMCQAGVCPHSQPFDFQEAYRKCEKLKQIF
jgi:hypothetical protein